MTALSRRTVLMGGAVLAGLAACGHPPAAPRPSAAAEPVPRVYDQLDALQHRHNADIGLYGVDDRTGRTLAYRDGDMFAVCSTFKVYAAARVLQRTERGELALTDPIYVEPAAVVANSPVTGPHAGGTLTLAQLCEAALQRSDNTAGNLLLKTIGGPPAITEFARSIGDDRTRLDRWETELNTAIPGDPRDTSTPRALGGGFRKLLTGSGNSGVLGAQARSQLEDWMRGSVTSVRAMRAGLPAGWTAADKSGAGDYGSTNDIGIAYGPDGRKVLLAVMTRSASANPKAENMQPLIAEVATLAVPWLIGTGP
jgi:beta-lactamase class A